MLPPLHMIFAAERNRRRFAAAEWPDSSNGMQLTWKNKRVVVVVVAVATVTSANIHIPYPSCILWFLDASSSPLQTLVPRGERNHFPTLLSYVFIYVVVLWVSSRYFLGAVLCFFRYYLLSRSIHTIASWILKSCDLQHWSSQVVQQKPVQKSEGNAAV